jgi:hypothetical protein
MKNQRDATKIYPVAEFITKLRRLADALESDSTFETHTNSI